MWGVYVCVSGGTLFCCVVLCVLSDFAIILLRTHARAYACVCVCVGGGGGGGEREI